MRVLLYIYCFLLPTFVFGQTVNQFQYFSDTTGGNFSHIYNTIEVKDGIIISGKRKIGPKESPVVIKINKDGEVVWSTANNTEYIRNSIYGFEIKMFSDSMIYGFTSESSSRYLRFWKINPKNGDVVWMKDYFESNGSLATMCDYDSAHYYISVKYINNTNRISLMNKSNGDTVTTIMYGSEICLMARDEKYNLYVACKNTLSKFNRNDFNTKLWSRTYDYINYNNDLVTVDLFHNIYMDENDNLFLFGRDGSSFGSGSGLVLNVNTSTGNKNWATVAIASKVKLIDFKDRNGFLYVTYQHALVGAALSYFNAAKLNKANGNLVWKSINSLTPLGSPAIHSADQQSALSLDLDCDGNVYLSGYYGDANYGPEQWGIMKLNGNDGSKIYDLTITNDSLNYNDLSSGLAVCVFEDSPIILGHLEYTPGTYKPYFVTIDPQSGQPIQRKFIGSTYQYPSYTQEIKSVGDSVVCFKQKGSSLSLELYDHNNSLRWEKSFINKDFLKAKSMCISNNHIYITYYSVNKDTLPPYTSDSCFYLYLAKYNYAGNRLLFDSLAINTVETFPMDLEVIHDTPFILYYQDVYNYLVKYSNGFSASHIVGVTSENIYYNGNIDVLNQTDTSLLYFSSRGIVNINPFTMDTIYLYSHALPLAVYDNYVDSNQIVLTGATINGQGLIYAFNRSLSGLLWTKTYSLKSCVYSLSADSLGHVYCALTSNDSLLIDKLDLNSGSVIWENVVETSHNTVPLDIEVCNGFVAVGSEIDSVNAGTNAAISMIALDNTWVKHHVYRDDVNAFSFVKTLQTVRNDFIWAGGAVNDVPNSKRGFIFILSADSTVITQLENDINAFDIQVYPNPANQMVSLSNLDNKPFKYEVFDISGKRCLYNSSPESNQINIASLSMGVYVLKIELLNENQKLYFKLIKQ